MSTQGRQAAPTSAGRQQGNLTCDNRQMEDGEGEASKLPKVSTALISTIYSCFPAACEGNTSIYINAQGTSHIPT